MSHIREHCNYPSRRKAKRYTNTPWICSCGKAWLATRHTDLGPPGALPHSWCTWREWHPWITPEGSLNNNVRSVIQ